MTIYEIAKKAGVSIATISRALNPETRDKVAPETLKRVDEIVRRHGYTPSHAAISLSRAVYKTVGVLIPHHAGILSQDYYSQILCGIADGLLETNHHLKIVMLKCEKPKWDHYNFKSGEGIDGLIVTHWRAFFSDKTILEKTGVPSVVINDPEDKVRAHFITADHKQGGRMVAEYLYNRGHRKIGLLKGPADSIDSGLRLEGFKSFMDSRKIAWDPSRSICGEFQEEKGRHAAGELLKKHPDLTAIFCLNDGMAFGALRKIRELGKKCPQDISVVGYDNDSYSAKTEPPLTTVQMPVYALALEAVKKLMARVHPEKTIKKGKKEVWEGVTQLPVKLIERGSVQTAA